MISTTGSIVNTQCTSLLVFDYPANYKISDETDVKVYYIDINGSESLLVNGPDYSITLITETGFNVELVASYDTGSLSIRRETPQVQETEFMPGGDFPASAFEDTLDRLVMMQQEMEEILSRAVTIAKADSGDMVLPAAASRINRFFAFDENGDVTTHPGTVPADANIIASDVDVLDIASNFTATDVEAALAETSVAEQLNTTHRSSDGKNHSDVVLNNTHRAILSGNPHIVKASEVNIADVDDNYTATEVEAILKEIADLKGIIASLLITDTTESIDKDTGALVVEGGVGIEKDVYVGGTINGLDGITVPIMHVQDQKASAISGGTFTSGIWQTRDLNTVMTNTITGASVSSNQITLPAGTYKIIARVPAYAVNVHNCRLYNISDTVTELSGESMHAYYGSGINNHTGIKGIITIASSKIFEIQHRCQTTSTTHGFGVNSGAMFTVDHETYTDVFIEKIG